MWQAKLWMCGRGRSLPLQPGKRQHGDGPTFPAVDPRYPPPLCASKSTCSLHVTSCVVQAAEHVVKPDCHPLQAGSLGVHQVGTSVTEGCGVEPMFRVFLCTDHLQDVDQSPTSVALNGENSRQSASLPVYWRLCGFLSFVSQSACADSQKLSEDQNISWLPAHISTVYFGLIVQSLKQH